MSPISSDNHVLADSKQSLNVWSHWQCCIFKCISLKIPYLVSPITMVSDASWALQHLSTFSNAAKCLKLSELLTRPQYSIPTTFCKSNENLLIEIYCIHTRYDKKIERLSFHILIFAEHIIIMLILLTGSTIKMYSLIFSGITLHHFLIIRFL